MTGRGTGRYAGGAGERALFVLSDTRSRPKRGTADRYSCYQYFCYLLSMLTSASRGSEAATAMRQQNFEPWEREHMGTPSRVATAPLPAARRDPVLSTGLELDARA